MKRLVALLLLAFSSLAAQQDEIQSEAVRAFQAGDYATAKSLFESLLAIDPKNPAARNYLRAISLREGVEQSRIGLKYQHPGGRFSRRDGSRRWHLFHKGQRVERGKQPMNVVWMVPGKNRQHACDVESPNMPASEVLRYLGRVNLRSAMTLMP
jgi:hypothetical protein